MIHADQIVWIHSMNRARGNGWASLTDPIRVVDWDLLSGCICWTGCHDGAGCLDGAGCACWTDRNDW